MINPNQVGHLAFHVEVLSRNREARLKIASEPVERFDRGMATIRERGLGRAILTGSVPSGTSKRVATSKQRIWSPCRTHRSSAVALLALGVRGPIVGTNLGGLPDLIEAD